VSARLLSLIERRLIEATLLASVENPFPTAVTSSSDPRVLFGKHLAELRRSRGWSQEYLALESGLARSYLGGVERGQRNIALLNIIRLANALELPPSKLLEFEDRNGGRVASGLS